MHPGWQIAKPSKISINVYSERDCDGPSFLNQDLTPIPYILEYPNGMIASFEVVNRGLESQEQLDI